MKLSILGQEYDFQEIDGKSDIKMEGNDGYCDGYGKIIRVSTSLNDSTRLVLRI
jgi:hypothetical protein